MKRPGALVFAVIFLAVSLACGQATRLPVSTPTRENLLPVEPTPGVDTAPPSDAQSTEPVDFVIAIEYAVPGLAAAYAETGVTAAKPQPIWGLWGNIEPEQGQYDWKPLDALVQEYQAAAYTDIQMLLTSESPWAATRLPKLGDKGDPFPREEYLDDYAAFVRSVVERYDGDGLDDMPGLLFAIHEYGIEREFTGYFPTGDAGQYLRLLRLAHAEIKAADPEAQVLLVALLLGDVFHDDPPAKEAELRLNRPSILSFSVGKVRTLLAACDLYDAVDFHSLAGYLEIPPTAAWIRAELEANGCGDKSIWIGDAFSMSGLIGYTDPFGWVPIKGFAPASEANAESVLALLQSVADAKAADHAESTAWLRAEMAVGLVRKIVVSAGEGLAGINIGNMEDWSFPFGTEFNQALVRSMGTSAYMGMLDSSVTLKTAGGPLRASSGGAYMARIRKPGERRPAFYALKLAISMLDGYSSIERLDLGPDVWAYRLETPGGPVWALWYDDGELHLPGDPYPEVRVTLNVEAAAADVTWTPTQAGQSEPESQRLDAPGGLLELALGPAPLFVAPSE